MEEVMRVCVPSLDSLGTVAQLLLGSREVQAPWFFLLLFALG